MIKKEQADLAAHKVDLELIGQYAMAVVRGSGRAIQGIVDTVLHPIDNMVVPILDLVHDSAVIIARHTPVPPIDPHGISGDTAYLRNLIEQRPEIYHASVARMERRLQNLQTQLGYLVFEAPGPEKVEALVTMGLSIYVPAKLFTATQQIVSNVRAFGAPLPLRYHPEISGAAWLEARPVRSLSINKIRGMQHEYLNYVIDNNRNLIITLQEYDHWHLGHNRHVYAAGDIEVHNGRLTFVDNRSGSYLPQGEHISNLVERTLVKNGYYESHGIYSDHFESMKNFEKQFGPMTSRSSDVPVTSRLDPANRVVAGAGVLRVIADGIKNERERQAREQQQAQEAQKKLADERVRHNAANYQAIQHAQRQVIANTRYYNLPFDMRYSSFHIQNLVWKAEQDAVWAFRLKYGSVPFFIEQQIKSSVHSYSYCLPSLSTANYFFLNTAEFALSLMVTNLINTYNAYNWGSYIYSSYGISGEIGGVATQVALIEDLINSDTHATADAYYLCLPQKNALLSDELFDQMAAILADAYFKHHTLPFFSLHFNQFNQNIFSYPVLHPAFQDNIVGDVIGFLDYWMKCFLNGGFFDEQFLRQWHETSNFDEAYLRSKMIDLKKYCKEKVPALGYLSLRELESRYGIKCERSSTYQQPFMTSFCIISDQDKIERQDNVLIAHPNFKVKYSIDLMPDYQQYIDSYRRDHGSYPPEYRQILQCYELYVQEIKEKMWQLPFCSHYFNLLGAMNSLCYFYTTLEQMGKRPVLEASVTKHPAFPKALPPIPVRYYKTYDIPITFKDILEPLCDTPEKTKVLDNALLLLFSGQKKLPETIFEQTKVVLRALVRQKLSTQLSPNDLIELDEDWVERIAKQSCSRIEKQPEFDSAEFIRQMNQLLAQSVIILNEVEHASFMVLPFDKKITFLQEVLEKQFKELNQEWNAVTPATESDQLAKLWLPRAKLEEYYSQRITKIQQELADLPPEIKTTKQAAIANLEKELTTDRLTLTQLQNIPQKGFFAKLVTLGTPQDAATSKQAVLRILPQIQQDVTRQLNRFKEVITTYFQLMRSDPGFNNLKVAKTYTHCFLSFTGSALAAKTGDNFQIVGGCGVSVPTIKSQPIAQGEFYCQLVAKSFKEVSQKKGQFEYNGVPYKVYRIPVLDVDEENVLTTQATLNKEIATAALADANRNKISPERVPELISSIAEKDPDLVQFALATLKPDLSAKIIPAQKELLQTAGRGGHLSIHLAAKFGNVEAIAKMLEVNPSLLEVKTKTGATPLMMAVQHGQQSVMELLHSKGADFNYCLPNGLFPLYMAIQKNFTPLALWMLEKVALLDVNKSLDSKMTALHLAIEGGDSKLAEQLLNKGARYDTPRKADGHTALHCAAQRGELTLIQRMLTVNALINLPLESKKTPLHLAAQAGQLETVKWLKDHGASLNAQTLEGETPLMLAICAGHREVALLLAESTPINIVNQHKQTSSQLALQYAMPLVADVLIKKGENISLIDTKGFSYIYYLVRNGEYQRVKQLLNQGYDFHQTCQGNSLLAIAAQHGHFLIVYALLERGIAYRSTTSLSLLDFAVIADEIGYLRDYLKSTNDLQALALLAIRNCARHCLSYLLKQMPEKLRQNKSLLMAAVAGNDEKILALILKHCKDINKPLDKEGNTALHVAVQHGAHLMIPKLAECGCQFNKLNAKKQTPFHLALLQEDAKLLRSLLRLSTPEEWPLDLWQPNLKTSPEINQILINYQKRLPNKSKLPTATMSNSQTKSSLPSAPILTDEQLKLLQEFTATIDQGSFEETAYLIKKNPILVTVLKSDLGGPLLQNMVSNLVALDPGTTPTVNFDPAVDKLFWLLKQKDIDPALYLGKNNLLLAIIRSEDDDQACYRFSHVVKYFEDSIPTLVLDTTSGISITQLVFTKEFHTLSEMIDALCQKQSTQYNGLHEAIQGNHYDTVAKRLKKYEVNAVNQKGQTPLMLAASQGNLPIINLLLQQGANVDQKDFKGNTALYYALDLPSQAAALTLLSLAKDSNPLNRMGVSPLMRAAAQSCLPVIHYLVEKGQEVMAVDDQGLNALHYAALAGKAEVLRYLVNHGFQIDQLETPIKPKKKARCLQRSPLHLAASKAQVQAVLCLLELGADPEREDIRGFALTEYAVCSRSKEMLEVVKLLPFYHNKNRNRSLLHAAVSVQNQEVLCELILDNVDLNAVDAYGRSALHVAAIKDCGEAARLLLIGGKMVLDNADSDGLAAIHYAASSGHVRLIEQLGKAGANLNLPSHEGDLPLGLACANGQVGAVVALLRQGANLTLTNQRGFTGAQVALLNGHYTIVNILREAGDQSLESAALAILPQEDRQQLSLLLSEYKRLYSSVKTSLLMKHSFHAIKKQEKPTNELNQAVGVTTPSIKQ
jgi:ankyrin repeat protein